jgi:hypothetical protein
VTIVACDVPADTLLHEYALQHYSDCYTTTVHSNVDLARFITAFYNSIGFRPERVLLGLVLGRHADNQSTANLAAGQTRQFSAWKVEKRLPNEILLADMSGATRSWLMVEEISPGLTRLYFGSAVVGESGDDGRRPLLFRALTPFHKVYSRVLLATAVSEL